MQNIILLFIIYGFLGWIVEVCYVRIRSGHFYNRGFLHMPFLPIYAVGAVIISLTLSDLSSPLIVYLVAVVLTSTLEYITSYIMERFFHTRWWDYSQNKFNIKGRICLLNSSLFGILAVIVIYIMNPFFLNVTSLIGNRIQVILINLFMIGLIVDLAYTLRDLNYMPVRDIRIISGKVKAYKDGKLRDLDLLAEELSDFRNTREEMKNELRQYKQNIEDKYQIHKPLIVYSTIVILLGILLGDIFFIQIIAVISIITIALVIYNRRHKNKASK